MQSTELTRLFFRDERGFRWPGLSMQASHYEVGPRPASERPTLHKESPVSFYGEAFLDTMPSHGSQSRGGFPERGGK